MGLALAILGTVAIAAWLGVALALLALSLFRLFSKPGHDRALSRSQIEARIGRADRAERRS